MSLNFPDAPANGQTFDNWMWDGQKWVVVGTPTGFLPLTGGTINGNLTVLGATTLNGTTSTTPPLNDYSSNVATTSWVKQQNYITNASAVTLNGDVLGSGPLANPIVTTLANSGVSPGIYQGLTIDAKGRITAATAINYVSSVSVSGDVTGTGTGTGTITVPAVLNTINPNVGTFNGITVNAKGLVTAAVNQNYLTGNQIITLSGDASGSGTSLINLILSTVNSTVGVFNGITVNAKGQVTNATDMGYLTTVSLTGDVTGSGGPSIATTTARLQGLPVATTAPTTNQVLAWSGTAWAPATPASGLPAANNYDVLIYTSGAWGNQRPKYAVGFSFVGGVLGASQLLGLHKFSKAITFGANFGNYLGHASEAGGTANATASTVISVDRAVAATPTTFTNVGSITIAAGSITPTFTTTGGATLSFAVGDIMRLIGPSTADTTFANLYATLVGYET